MKMFKVLLMIVLAIVVTGGTAYAGVTLVTPNGGETWTQGSNQDITWSYTGSQTGNVKLTLIKGTVENLIKDNMPMKDKKYSWKVGEYAGGTAPAGSDYKIKITKLNSSFEDISNGTFTISTKFSKELIGKVEKTVLPQLSLHITFPNGGETLEAGLEYPVKWGGSSVGSGNVEICVKGSDIPCATVPNTGSWQWKIPFYANYGSFKMSITVPGTNIQDESDGTFKITNWRKIRITSPKVGELWCVYRPWTITWDTGGGWDGGQIRLFLHHPATVYAMILSPVMQNTGSYTVNIMMSLPDSDRQWTENVLNACGSNMNYYIVISLVDNSGYYLLPEVHSPLFIVAMPPCL